MKKDKFVKSEPNHVCKHGKKFCCECKYGKHNSRDFVENPIDAYEEINRTHARFGRGLQ